jgi:hypothetical protein
MAFGFPSKKDMSEMFGYVTPEDQEKWDKQREANKQSNPGTAQQMAAQSIKPALDLAERGIRAQMHGAQNEAQRGAQAKQRVVTRETYTEQSRNIDGSESDYTPGF